MKTPPDQTENDTADAEQQADPSCYCFIVDKPSDTKTCNMTKRCDNASEAVSELIDNARSK